MQITPSTIKTKNMIETGQNDWLVTAVAKD
jgi:hypothetical protein